MSEYIKRYSYSALSTYEQCPLKYDLSYVKKIRMPKVYSYDLTKGLIFHTFAELYRSLPQFSDFRYLLDYAFNNADDVDPKWLGKLTLEERQTITNAIREFRDWWDKKFPNDDATHKIKREYTLEGKAPFPFTGVVDLIYEDQDGVHVVDYKTPKNAEIKYHRSQLELYGHFLGEALGKPIASLNVYYAFAHDVKNGERLYSVPLKLVTTTPLRYKEIVDEINSPNRKVEANLNRMCDYCQYRGLKDHCPVSVIAGAKPQQVS